MNKKSQHKPKKIRGKKQVANEQGTEEARIDYENQENYSGSADQQKRTDFAQEVPGK